MRLKTAVVKKERVVYLDVVACVRLLNWLENAPNTVPNASFLVCLKGIQFPRGNSARYAYSRTFPCKSFILIN